MKEFFNLPVYVIKSMFYSQLRFGIPYSALIAGVLTLLFLHNYINLYVLVILSVLGVLFVAFMLQKIRSMIFLSCCFLELNNQVANLCLLDEGFEEFWKKYEDGFSPEEMTKIKTVRARNYARASAKEIAD